MKFSTATALAILAAGALAAPAMVSDAPAPLAPRAVTEVPVLFQGPTTDSPDVFWMDIKDNDTGVKIDSSLIVARIKVFAAPDTTCSFDGFEGSHVTTKGQQTVDVPRPQRQVFATCVSECQRTGNNC